MIDNIYVFFNNKTKNDNLQEFFNAFDSAVRMHFIIVGSDDFSIEKEKSLTMKIPFPIGAEQSLELSNDFLATFGKRLLDILSLEDVLYEERNSVFILTDPVTYNFAKAISCLQPHTLAAILREPQPVQPQQFSFCDVLLCSSSNLKHHLICSNVNKEIYRWDCGARKPVDTTNKLGLRGLNLKSNALILVDGSNLCSDQIIYIIDLLEGISNEESQMIVYGDVDFHAFSKKIPFKLKHRICFYGRLLQEEIVVLMQAAKLFLIFNSEYDQSNHWLLALSLGVRILVKQLPEDFDQFAHIAFIIENLDDDVIFRKALAFCNISVLEDNYEIGKLNLDYYYYDHKRYQLLQIFNNRF